MEAKSRTGTNQEFSVGPGRCGPAKHAEYFPLDPWMTLPCFPSGSESWQANHGISGPPYPLSCNWLCLTESTRIPDCGRGRKAGYGMLWPAWPARLTAFLFQRLQPPAGGAPLQPLSPGAEAPPSLLLPCRPRVLCMPLSVIPRTLPFLYFVPY